jgi:pyruvate dehydrogenase E2 component (dihydrolipoamide acetyltransferase)
MATRIVMSKLSPTMEEGRVLQWVKHEGEPVDSGDVIVEVETDKATMEVEAMGSGLLRKVLVAEGMTVPTGTVLGVIAAEDEDISALLDEARAAAPAATTATAPVGEDGPNLNEPPVLAKKPTTSVAEAPAAEPAPEPAPQLPEAPRDEDGRTKVSPLARRMAEDRGLSLRSIQGTGPGGRIIRRDVEAAVRGGKQAPDAAVAWGPEVPYERVELSQIRKAIARNLVQSLGPVPHFFLTVEIDMGRVLALRSELNASLQGSGAKIGVNEVLIKTAAQALVAHPNVNVAFAGDHIRRFTRVDVGVAVAMPDGLITPVLRDAESKGLLAISEELHDLIERGREKKLAPEEYQGATFTISNLGMYGIDEFTAVINPPAATVMAVGATVEKPVAIDGSIEIRSRMRVTLSCDHRAVDGAMGADFLATFKNMLENPLRLVL